MPSSAELAKLGRFQWQRLQRLLRMRRPYRQGDAAMVARAADLGDDASALSDELVAYFWAAQRHYSVRGGTLAYYPGHPSIYGARNDAIEGVSRLMPVWAAYVTSPGAAPRLAAQMRAHLRQTLALAFDPHSSDYWGQIGDRSTLICEAADVALALWLLRDDLWATLDGAKRELLLAWLRQAVGRETADNNWHLFVVLIDAVLAELDPQHRFSSAARLTRIREFARSDGCFVDGPKGDVDFYNAWGFHYPLFWLRQMPVTARLAGFGAAALREFCDWYQCLFTPTGLPLFGRSLCYRFAASTPLLACALEAPEVVAPGVAKRAYLLNWRYFIAEGGLAAGRPTQGVFADDLRWLDAYSGPASSLWGTRSLVSFLYAKRTLDWASVPMVRLPAEAASIDRWVEGLQARLLAEPAEPATVRLSFASSAGTGGGVPQVQLQTRGERMREWIYADAWRPTNNLLKSGVSEIDSTLAAYR
ncbi:DUF2264 domain-containing protein [Paucibacter soli]|uniref:DUF2264 domain-containing protein n=1 Tax=Paucibacter soli TaxID=3133433 RepID=UPI0030A33A76